MTYEAHGHNSGRLLYSGSGDKTVRAWSAASGELFRTFEGHGGPVHCLQVVVDVLYSGSGDNTVRSVRFVRPSLAPQLRAAPSAAGAGPLHLRVLICLRERDAALPKPLRLRRRLLARRRRCRRLGILLAVHGAAAGA